MLRIFFSPKDDENCEIFMIATTPTIEDCYNEARYYVRDETRLVAFLCEEHKDLLKEKGLAI